MSLSGDSTKYLIVTNACGATMPYLDHIWAYADAALSTGALVASGQTSNQYVFTVSGVTVDPTAGAIYRTSGDTIRFTVVSETVSGGSGTVTTTRTTGTDAPAATGTLTKVSGTGDATITYSAFTDSQNHARSVRSSGGTPNYGVARSRSTGSNNSNVIAADITGAGAELPIANTWNSYSAAFVSNTSRTGFCNGAAGTTNTSNDNPGTPAYTRIFGDLDGGSAAATLWHCEWSRWDLTGMSGAQIQTLVTALSTITNDAIPNASLIDAEVGGIGENRCIVYFTLKDRTAASLVDRIGGSITLTEAGTWGDDQVHPHPTVDGVYPPSLSSASADPMVQGTAVTITGTNLKPLGVTAPTVTYNGTAVTLTSSSNTQIVFTPTEPVLYGVAYPLTLTNETGLSLETGFSIATIPASGETYYNITETVASSGLRITDTPDIDVGSQVHIRTAIQDAGGLDTAMTITDVIIEGDGTIAVDTNPDVTFRVDFQRRTTAGTTWTSWADVSVTLYVDPTIPVLIGDDTVAAYGTRGVAFSLALIDLVSATATWTWTRHSGDAFINGLTINSSTGAITGTPTAAGTTVSVIRATGSGGYVAITVTITIASTSSATTARKPGKLHSFGGLGFRG